MSDYDNLIAALRNYTLQNEDHNLNEFLLGWLGPETWPGDHLQRYTCGSCYTSRLAAAEMERCPVCYQPTCEDCRCPDEDGRFVICQHCADEVT